MGATITL